MRLAPAHVVIAALFATAVPAAAQQHQHETRKEEKHEMKGHAMSPWKEMDLFHNVLGPAFHPVEKGDFAPLKARASELAATAKAWAESTAPAACNSPALKETVKALATSTAALAEQVKAGASDASLKSAISSIHDTFEKAEGGCVAKHDMKH